MPRVLLCVTSCRLCLMNPVRATKIWSGRRDLNPRLRPWQGRTLPLSYSRSAIVIINDAFRWSNANHSGSCASPPSGWLVRPAYCNLCATKESGGKHGNSDDCREVASQATSAGHLLHLPVATLKTAFIEKEIPETKN